jgi:Flp pilus assembly protein TadD
MNRNPEVNRWQSDIARAERAGDFREAARLRRGFLDSGVAPDPAGEAFRLARLYEEHLKRPQDALYWYRRAATLGGADHHYALEAERGAERLRHAVSISDLDRQDREAALQRAIDAGEFDAAEKLAEEMHTLYPHAALPHFALGFIASQRQNHSLAAALYHEAMTLDPDHERAHFNLAIALQKAERWVEARDAWRRYLDKFGDRESASAQAAREALAGLNDELNSNL